MDEKFADVVWGFKLLNRPLVEKFYCHGKERIKRKPPKKYTYIYKGKQTGEGKKSMAYAIVYRDSKKSLKDEDVNKVHDKILKALESKLGAQLR